MTNDTPDMRTQQAIAANTASMPPIVDRAAFQTELDALRKREKALTRESDAIAAARRRLPMVEVDAGAELIGPDGPTTLLDAFEGRRQLLAYYFMWHHGHPAAEQCEGCTWCTTHVSELSYLHSRDITFAVLCYVAGTTINIADVQTVDGVQRLVGARYQAVVGRPTLSPPTTPC